MRARSGNQMFGNRFDLHNEGHAAITLGVADTDGTPLLGGGAAVAVEGPDGGASARGPGGVKRRVTRRYGAG